MPKNYKKKLDEEIAEAKQDLCPEEVADVYEVHDALTAVSGLTVAIDEMSKFDQYVEENAGFDDKEVEAARHEKGMKNGHFALGIFIKTVTVPEDNVEMIDSYRKKGYAEVA